MKQFKELREFKTALSFFDLKSATKAERLAKSMGILKDSEKKGKQYTVYVDGKFTDITKWLKKLDTSESVEESDANWAKSLEKINKQRQLDKISDKDKETIMKIAALLGKEKKRR